MTRDEVENVVKRYPEIIRAIERNLNRAIFYVGNRKFVIEVTEQVKAVCDVIKIVYEGVKNNLIKGIIKMILCGESDVYIMQRVPYCRNAYYAKKQAFLRKVYDCCIARKIVSAEEAFDEEIA